MANFELRLSLIIAAIVAVLLTFAVPAVVSAQTVVQQPAAEQTVAQGQTRSIPNSTMKDLSPWSMFMSADWLVKLVMVSLAFASLVTWTILIAKSYQLLRLKQRLTADLGRVTRARNLTDAEIGLRNAGSIVGTLLHSAIEELHLSSSSLVEDGVKERVASRLTEVIRGESRAIRQGMSALATIGATAPFVGLFGTVWGIMNSFIGISQAQTTNLAVVAPGIAEALLATAIGLVAAIPAVVIYNHFARATKSYLELVNRASGATARLLSRELDGVRGTALARAAE